MQGPSVVVLLQEAGLFPAGGADWKGPDRKAGRQKDHCSSAQLGAGHLSRTPLNSKFKQLSGERLCYRFSFRFETSVYNTKNHLYMVFMHVDDTICWITFVTFINHRKALFSIFHETVKQRPLLTSWQCRFPSKLNKDVQTTENTGSIILSQFSLCYR